MPSSRGRGARRNATRLLAAAAAVVLMACMARPHRAEGDMGAVEPMSSAAAEPKAPAAMASAAVVDRPAKRPLPAERQTHRHADGAFHLYPPLPRSYSTDAGAPIVMMLHGMCSDPLASCDHWSRAGREGSFLVCPAGNGRCGDRPDWTGTGERKARFLDNVRRAVDERYREHLATDGQGILIGFSRGAFVARDVAYARPGRYRGIIFIGAALSPDPRRLKDAGVVRVVLAAGEYDGARPTMQRAAARLNAAGLPARYVSTGKIDHQLPSDMEAFIRDAITWIRDGLPGARKAGGARTREAPVPTVARSTRS